MNVIAEITRINQLELDKRLVNTPALWHQKYNQCDWVYYGNQPTSLSEGNIIGVMSQYGEIEDIHLVRDSETGKSKGFCFCKYDDQHSTVLAVDNLTGTKILDRSIRVDHVEQYRLPKHLLEKKEKERNLGAGHAYDCVELKNEYTIHQGHDLFARPSSTTTTTTTTTDNRHKGDKEQYNLEKQKRKEERDLKRRERNQRREQKEETRRESRAKKMYDVDDNSQEKKSRKERMDKNQSKDHMEQQRKKRKQEKKEDRNEKWKFRHDSDDDNDDEEKVRHKSRKRRKSHSNQRSRSVEVDSKQERTESRLDSE